MFEQKKAKIEDSMQSVLEQLIQEEDKSIRALCTHEVAGCSVDITKASSSLATMKMAATLGYKSGFALDLTTEDANGKKWDLFRPADSQRSRGEIERGSSVVTGSIASFDSVRHDAVAEIHKVDR